MPMLNRPLSPACRHQHSPKVTEHSKVEHSIADLLRCTVTGTFQRSERLRLKLRACSNKLRACRPQSKVFRNIWPTKLPWIWAPKVKLRTCRPLTILFGAPRHLVQLDHLEIESPIASPDSEASDGEEQAALREQKHKPLRNAVGCHGAKRPPVAPTAASLS